MAVYSGSSAGVPRMEHSSVNYAGIHSSSSRGLDSQYRLRVTSLPNHALGSRLRRPGVINALLQHSLTIPALSLELRNRKMKNQLLRSSSSLGDGNSRKLVRPQSNPCRLRQRKLHVVKAQVTELASGLDVINNLGLDTLTFLGATVLVVPAFKAVKQSPVRDLHLHAFGFVRFPGQELQAQVASTD